MNALDLYPDKAGDIRTRHGGSLNVVAACDGLIGGGYAHEAVESVGMACGPDTLIRSSYWSFNMLGTPAAEKLSVGIAVRADLLVIAAFAEVPLSDTIKSWVSKVLQRCQGNAPLIAAFHPELPDGMETNLPMCRFLADLATSWNTRFLCNESFDEQLDRGLVSELLRRQCPPRNAHDDGRMRQLEWCFAG